MLPKLVKELPKKWDLATIEINVSQPKMMSECFLRIQIDDLIPLLFRYTFKLEFKLINIHNFIKPSSQ